MRLSKRIAACVLTAAMALTMLAGCSGTPSNPSNGGNNNGGSNTSTSGSTNGSNTDNNGSNGNSNSNGSNSDSTNSGASAIWQNSKTYQYVKMLNSSEMGMDTDWRITNGTTSVSANYIYEKYGDGNVYVKETQGSVWNSRLLQDGWVYIMGSGLKLNSGKEICLKEIVDDLGQQEALEDISGLKDTMYEILSPNKPSSIQSGTKKLGTSTYDTESFERTLGTQKYQVDCYYIGTTLKYIVLESSSQRATITINKLSNRANSSYFRVPSNYEIWIVDKYGNLYDEDHNYIGKFNNWQGYGFTNN